MAAVLLMGLFVTAYLGFAALALSQRQHWQRVTASSTAASPRTALLRWAGSALITLSLALAILRDGASFGSILCVVVLAVAGAAVIFTLSVAPRRLRPLARMFVITPP